MTQSPQNRSDTQIDWNKGDGLVPAIVQHYVTGRVLMLGFMNEESLHQSRESGKVTFFSRSRNTLWCKGETSGNTLQLISVDIDCDNDTLLVQAKPAGPTCHLNTESCFDEPSSTNGKSVGNGFGFLGQLEAVINSRKGQPASDSYTASLFESGIAKMAQKVGEEGVEVALAAVQQNHSEILSESADLLYHLLVVLADQGLTLEEVVKVLESRHQ